jgi:hypothetical protein
MTSIELLVAASAVGIVTAAIGFALFVGVLALGIWAVRQQSKQFPKGFDRTGWNPDGERAGWFQTKFTWLSGGGGGGGL